MKNYADYYNANTKRVYVECYDSNDIFYDKRFEHSFLLLDDKWVVDTTFGILTDIETYNDTIGEFLVGANEKLPKIKYYKDMKDMANYAILVHSLKSDAKYFGFTKLADLAYQHELKSKENDKDYVVNNFINLENEYKKVIDTLEKKRSYSKCIKVLELKLFKHKNKKKS